MKLIILLAFVVFTDAFFNIRIESHSPSWPRINESTNSFPESPADANEGQTEVPGDDQILGDDVAGVVNASTVTGGLAVEARAEDLSYGYTPGYCRCINKYYCFGANYQRERVQRAVNTPPCRNRDEVMCCLTSGPGCGVPANFPYFNPYPLYGEANFGDHPWTALVMDVNNRVIYGLGITIAWRIVVTTARNVAGYSGNTLKVRLGEWDLSSNDEPFKPQEFPVSEVIIHPKFNPKTFQNDIAILRLASNVDLSSVPSIRSACLARPEESFKYIGAKCLVAGWGSQPSAKERKKRQGSQVSDPSGTPSQSRNILKEVDMQVLDGPVCQEALRRNVGNPEFFLDQTSFVCAGGDSGKGLCRGDEGAALVCQEKKDARYTLVGMASWGTTCGQSGFPNVFTNIANYYDWIKSVEPGIGQ
ncbi:Chymotrypsin-like protease CTRL-1 [Orchesella cincta]|uniref:Chymotrypsin-like protease CTRL-1 n=1 Tax=Orchesella cincta TaxID=48709 RepID=A0A1D2NMI9_ORCCI|nr:Chymotrypsin-like protease CTRL-1 [Orchesella cincta]